VKITPRSETDAVRNARRELLSPGSYLALIVEAAEKPSRRGNDMIELLLRVTGKDGGERELRAWLVANDRGALLMRHAAEAVGALSKYEAGEISAEDFPGYTVRVKIVIQKRRGYPDSNIVEDFAAVSDSSVVNLRAAG
jgi:hypothetical protein